MASALEELGVYSLLKNVVKAKEDQIVADIKSNTKDPQLVNSGFPAKASFEDNTEAQSSKLPVILAGVGIFVALIYFLPSKPAA